MALITDLALVVALWATGIGIGAVTPISPRAWWDRRRWLGLGIALNVLAVPLAALAVARLVGLSEDATTGVVLVASAAGGALGLTTSRVAGGDLPGAVALVLLLEVLNLVTIPGWSAALLGARSPVPVAEVARTLALLLVAPLVAGVLLRRLRPLAARGAARLSGRIASLGLAVVAVTVLWESAPVVGAALGTGLPVAALVLIGGCLAAGAALGGPGAGGRVSLSMVTAGRSSALALAIARGAAGDRAELGAAVVVIGLVGVLLPVALAFGLGWRMASAARRDALTAEAG